MPALRNRQILCPSSFRRTVSLCLDERLRMTRRHGLTASHSDIFERVNEAMQPWEIRRRFGDGPTTHWDRVGKYWFTSLTHYERAVQCASLSREQIAEATIEFHGEGLANVRISVADVAVSTRVEVAGTSIVPLGIPLEVVGLHTPVRVSISVLRGTIRLIQRPLWVGDEQTLPLHPQSVNVVMVNYRRADLSSSVVRFLNQSLDQCDCDFAVFVVDNDSGDGSAERLSAEKCTVLVSPTNGGGSGGLRFGIPRSLEVRPADLVWVLDDDVALREDTFFHLLAAVDDSVGVAGSLMMQMDDPLRIHEYGGFVSREGNLAFNEHDVRFHYTDRLKVIDVDFVAGASLLVRRDVLDRCGYQPDWFVHFDDVEWCARIHAAGYRVVAVADSIIWHQSGKVKRAATFQYYDVRNHLNFLALWHPTLLRMWVRIFRRFAASTWIRGLWHESDNTRLAMRDFYHGISGRGTPVVPPIQAGLLRGIRGVALISPRLLEDPECVAHLMRAIQDRSLRLVVIGKAEVPLPRSMITTFDRARTSIGYFLQLLRLRGVIDVVITGQSSDMKFPWAACDKVLIMVNGRDGYVESMPFREWVWGFIVRVVEYGMELVH